MVTDTNAICRIQGQLLCSDIAPGAVCAPSGKQRCSDLLELRPDFDASLRQTSQYSGLRPTSSLGSELKDGSPRSACDPRLGRNRGSVLSVHLAWPPPKPPASALLRVALRFVTASHKHRMNWVPVLLQEVAAQGVPRRLAGVPCSSARLEDGAIFRSFFTGERHRPPNQNMRDSGLAMVVCFQKLRCAATLRRLRWAAVGRGWDLPRARCIRWSERVDDRLLRAVPRLAGHPCRGTAAILWEGAEEPTLHAQHSGRHLPSAQEVRAILWRRAIIRTHRRQRHRRRRRGPADKGWDATDPRQLWTPGRLPQLARGDTARLLLAGRRGQRARGDRVASHGAGPLDWRDPGRGAR